MALNPHEHRVVRRGPDGTLYQWSNSPVEQQPSGNGWEHASKAKFPRVRSYLWFRTADNIGKDKEKLQKAQANLTTLPQLLLHPMQWFRTKQAMQKVDAKYKAGDRVTFNGDVYYVINAATADGGMTIKSAITGATKTISEEEVFPAQNEVAVVTPGTRVKLASGTFGIPREMDALVISYDKGRNKYVVSLTAKDLMAARKSGDVAEIYPESVNAITTGKDNVKRTIDNLRADSGLLSDSSDRYVAAVLAKAAEEKRQSLTVQDIEEILAANGHPLAPNEITKAVAELQKINPQIQVNKFNQSIFIGDSYSSLAQIAETKKLSRNIGMDKSANATETYVYDRQKVQGEFGEGIVKSIDGKTAKVKTSAGTMVDVAIGALKDALSGKSLVVDPANPRRLGKINTRDPFWLLKDRDSVRGYRIGDSAHFLKGLSKTAPDGVLRVTAVNDDGTLRLQDDKGQEYSAFGRQLEPQKIFESPTELDEFLKINLRGAYNKQFRIGGNTITIGDDSRKAEGKKSIEITFPNGKAYLDQEHLFFEPMTMNSATYGGTSILRMLGFEQGTPEQTMAPSRTVHAWLRRLYPSAHEVSIARDTNPQGPMAEVSTQVRVKLSVDAKHPTLGKRMDLGRIHEHFGARTGQATIPASDINLDTSVRCVAEGSQMHVYLGKQPEAFVFEELPDLTTEIAGGTGVEFEKNMRSRQLAHTVPEKVSVTFRNVVNAPMYAKQEKWGKLTSAPQLIDQSSVFSYDEANDRYNVDLAHYKKAKDFLEYFFGRSFKIYESKDAGYYAEAEHNILADVAAERGAEHDALLKQKTNTTMDARLLAGLSKNTVLRPYQVAAVNFGLAQRSSLLAMDQGTGKTYAAIGGAVADLNRWKLTDTTPKKRKILIIAPAAVAQTTWANDLARCLRYSEDPKKRTYDFAVLMGKDRTAAYQRLSDPADKTCIAVTSYQTFALEDFKEIKNLGFDKIILDEAQTIKNDNDEQRAGIIVSHVKDVLDDVEKKQALTGTPLENRAEDLQSILQFLSPNLFGNKADFMANFVDVERVVKIDPTGRKFMAPVGIRLKNLTALRSKLDSIMFRLTKDELVDNPLWRGPDVEKPYTIYPEDLPKFMARYNKSGSKEIGDIAVVPRKVRWPRYDVDTTGGKFKLIPETGDQFISMEGYPEYQEMIRKAKERLRAEYIAEIKSGKSPNYNKTLLRLQQVMNDPSILATKYGPDFYSVPNPKVDRLGEILQAHFAGENKDRGKVIIFTHYVETIKFLKKRLAEMFPNMRNSMIMFVGKGADVVGSNDTRSEIARKFNQDNNYKIMLANDAAKTGLNLPAANRVINYDVEWNPQDVNQRIDRAHRVRSIKDIATEKWAPVRRVFAHTLAVVGPDGDVNSTVEARKLFVHNMKEKIFRKLVNYQVEEQNRKKAGLPAEDNAEISYTDEKFQAEALLDVNSAEGIGPVAPGESRRYREEKARSATRRGLVKKHGLIWGDYFAKLNDNNRRAGVSV